MDQSVTGEPFIMAEAKEAQQAYDDKLRQAEEEKKVAQVTIATHKALRNTYICNR